MDFGLKKTFPHGGLNDGLGILKKSTTAEAINKGKLKVFVKKLKTV